MPVFGSLGDLYPLIALGQGLEARGHRVAIASNRLYQPKIEQAGLTFEPLRPELPTSQAMFDEVMDRQRGPERLIRNYILAGVEATYTDLMALMERYDALLNSPLCYPGPLVARQWNKPWGSVTLAPLSLFSCMDPPVLPVMQQGLPSGALSPLSGATFAAIKRLSKWVTWPWLGPLRELYRQAGMPLEAHPLFEGQFSPRLNLALWSPSVIPSQPDWPAGTVATGFLFHDEGWQEEHTELPAELEAFLQAGPPPIVFTLGSAAVNVSTDFYAQSLEAVKALGQRAVFVTGAFIPRDTAGLATEQTITVPYARYSQVFPRASVVVHQGGIGTTAHALRAGKPMLIVPFSFDQPDNAFRMQRLGVGLTLPREKYQARRAVPLLRRLLKEPQFSHHAERLAGAIHPDMALLKSCQLIEQRLFSATVDTWTTAKVKSITHLQQKEAKSLASLLKR